MQQQQYDNGRRPNRIWALGIGIIILILAFGLLITAGKWIEDNGANEILVVQSPLSGKITIYTTPGRKWQGWGRVTHYNKSSQFSFLSAEQSPDKKTDNSIKVRFNDGGHGNISGVARFDLPLDEKSINDFHATFGSQQSIENQLIRTVISKSVYMTGALMSSKQSYAEMRPDLINLIEDQAVKGVFQTVQVSREVDDPATGTKKWMTVVDLRHDKQGAILRQEVSPLVRFHVTLYNIGIQGIDYDAMVESQIKTQQEATMAVQTAIAQSKKAEQDKLTFEFQGQASAAKAKWEQEVVKATEVTSAQKDKEVAEIGANRKLKVAELDKMAAEQKKQENILLGQGEAERKKLVMAADGALEVKTRVYEAVQARYAEALARHQGPLVPTLVMGGSAAGGATTQGSTVTDFMSILQAKAAKDLALDLALPTATRTASNNQPITP